MTSSRALTSVPALSLRIALLACTWLAAPAAMANTWADYEALFPSFPCSDGWMACERGGSHHTVEPSRSSANTPIPAGTRVDFLTLKATEDFDPFAMLSDYSKIAAPNKVAAPVPEPLPEPEALPPVPDPEPEPEPTTAGPKADVVAPKTEVVAVVPKVVPEVPEPPKPSLLPPPKPGGSGGIRPKPDLVAKVDPPTPEPPKPVVAPEPVKPDPPAPEPALVKPQPPAPEPALVKPEPPAPEPATADAFKVEGCSDLKAMEPLAMMGRLDGASKACLEDRIRTASAMTDKKATSIVLIQNAWIADKKEWASLTKRHLEEIDKSDPTLCYKYAQYLQKAGQHNSVIRWADVALENKTYWTGETFTSRVYSLYKLKAASANALWLKAEEKYNAGPSADLDTERGSARSKAKVMAREWLDYAKSAGKDTTKALQYCESAAGNTEYCQ